MRMTKTGTTVSDHMEDQQNEQRKHRETTQIEKEANKSKKSHRKSNKPKTITEKPRKCI